MLARERPAPSDADLASAARRGSDGALRELITRYERPVYNLIVRLSGDRGAADDLAQETFIKAWSRLDTYDPTRKFANWILKIAHNATIDYLRRTRPETLSIDDDANPGVASALWALPPETPAQAIERASLARSLETALARLRPAYRAAIVLRYQEGCSYEEIAHITGLPLGTIKTQVHRARKEMAGQLEAEGWRPSSSDAVRSE